MAMTFQFNINPFGYQNQPIEIASMSVHSEYDRHTYTIAYKTKDGRKCVRGWIPKKMPDGTYRSGHRNLFHLLSDILDDVDLNALGQDYIHVLEQMREQTGYTGRVSDYPGE